jgi:outer membrane protein assembly factor BamB
MRPASPQPISARVRPRSAFLGTLTALGSLWASDARAQGGMARPAPCAERWTYEIAPTASYLSPLFVSDSAGDFFWWEQTGAAELVAVRDGRTRWRRRLSTLKRPGGSLVSATLVRDDLLVVSFESTIVGLRTSDGRVVWSRDLPAALAPELRKAGILQNTELDAGSAVLLGRAVVTAIAVGRSGAWLVATGSDGKTLWRSRIAGAAARMAADGDRLYILRSEVASGEPSIIAVDSNGQVVDSRVPFVDSVAVTGGEVVFDGEQVVRALIHPLANNCPPGSPCLPPPSMLTVTGISAGQERWHLSHPAGLTRMQLLLLSDGSVLLIDNQHVGGISRDGALTPLCELPIDEPRFVAGLKSGDLVVGRFRDIGAYALPGAPQLASTGWVMHGAGPAQGWAVRAARATPFVQFPAGVADPATDVAYVQTDAGVTTALDLADGTVKWHTQSHARPVGIWNGRVVALVPYGSALRVAQLDPVSGAAVTTSDPIPIKDWDSPTLAPWGEPLWTEVRIDRNRAHVAWEVSINGWSGGAQITPYAASGGADVDLASGAVSLSPTKSLEGPRPIRSPQGPLAAVVGGRKFTLIYAATATLTASNATSGKELWTRQLWSIAMPERREVPPP